MDSQSEFGIIRHSPSEQEPDEQMDKDLVLGVTPRSTMFVSIVFGIVGAHPKWFRKGTLFGITMEFRLLIVRVAKGMVHIVLGAFGVDMSFVVGSTFRVKHLIMSASERGAIVM